MVMVRVLRFTGLRVSVAEEKSLDMITRASDQQMLTQKFLLNYHAKLYYAPSKLDEGALGRQGSLLVRVFVHLRLAVASVETTGPRFLSHTRFCPGPVVNRREKSYLRQGLWAVAP